MTIKPFLKLASAAVMMGALGTANAASISITPGNIEANVGDIVSMEIAVDFSDVSTIGGGFDVQYDSSALGFVDFASAYPGDPDFSRQPDINPGLLEGFAFGDFNGVIAFSGVVGVLQFEILSEGSSIVTGADTNSITGPFLDLSTFQPIPVDYNAATVTGVGTAVIPVPAAAWLMFGGLGALFGFGRKRA